MLRAGGSGSETRMPGRRRIVHRRHRRSGRPTVSVPGAGVPVRAASQDRHAFTAAETYAVTLGAVIPAVAFALVALPVAGIVWLLATLPGVCYVAVSGGPWRA